MSEPNEWQKMLAELGQDLRRVVHEERAQLVEIVARHEERLAELERLLAERYGRAPHPDTLE